MAMPVAGTKLGPTLHLALHNIHHNVKAYGAVGDGVADDTAAIQAAIDAASAGDQVLIPVGNYKLTSALTLESKAIRLSGVHSANPDQANSGTRLFGSVNGPLIQRTGGDAATKQFVIEDLTLDNSHTTGTALLMGGLESPGGLYRCHFRGHIGISLTGGAGVFQFAVENCRFNVGATTYAGSIGIDTGGHAQITNFDIAGYERGILARGPSASIVGGRIETCGTGFYAGTGGTLFRGTCADINFEACDTAIYINEAASAVFSGHSIFGSVGSPLAGSLLGININSTFGVSIIGVEGSGTFVTAFVQVPGAAQRNGLSFISCYGTPWAITEYRNLQLVSCHDTANSVEVDRAAVVATASLPAAGASQDGMMVIEDAGAGNRNLILYAGGQRFRIDGGAAV